MSTKRPPLDFDAIQQAANGRYVDSIFTAAGISFSKHHKQHQSCPLCGGSDRFRCDDKRGAGTWICSQCGAGNGVSLIMQYTKCDAYDAHALMASALGFDGAQTITDAQRDIWKSEQIERETIDKAAKRQARIDAASRAQSIWTNAVAADDDHPYLLRKKVSALTLRQDNNDNLIIPMHYYNVDSKKTTLVNVQTIAPDSDKLFLKGGLVSGAYHIIGTDIMMQGGIILLAEGYATGASIFDAMGYSLPVVVAFNAHNLIPVAQSIRAQHPNYRIIICADDDTATAIKMRDIDIAKGNEPKPLVEYNAGIRDGKAAAIAIGGEIVIVNFDVLDINKDAA